MTDGNSSSRTLLVAVCYLACVHIILVRFGLLSGHILEIAAHLVDHMTVLFVF